jgi:PAS domain S-box-containing protein
MRSDLSGELVRALDQNEIVPYYQPLVDLLTRRLVGFEILARWHHPVRQIIYPSEFIPLAEKTGMIGILTERLLRIACLAATDWPPEISLSVNISSLQLHDPAMPERLQQVVEETQFPLNRLILEVTESALIEDLDLARSILGNLKSRGAHLSIDDFGTGYSGLRHLQMLPFDTLKLDASFVRTMTTHRESRKIVAAVMGLCQNLGLTSVAEGIETESQWDMLRCLGYHLGQGWLFGSAAAAPASVMLDDVRQRSHGQSTAPIAELVALRLEAMPIQCLWQLHALYEGAPVGLAFVDPQLRYIAVNERLAEMHGLPIASFLGRPIAEVIPELIEHIEPRFRRALAGESLKDQRTDYRSRDRRHRRVLLSSYQPVRDFSGEVVGVSLAVVDITHHLSLVESKEPQPQPLFQRT